jgi:hypothetical protein
MRVTKLPAPLGLVLAVAVALSACRSSKEETYNFDPAAHERATELKSRALGLIAVSGEPFSRHREDAESVNAAMEEAHELAAAAPENELVTAGWAAMKDPAGDLYGGFVRRWQASGTVNQEALSAAMDQTTVHFDYILCLEAAKRTKAGRCTPPGQQPVAEPQPESAPMVAAPR